MARGGSSWHTPHLSSYRSLPLTARLYVIFLQRLPEETRTGIIKKLEDVNTDWTSKFSDNPPDRRILQDVPWIRDRWPSPFDILSIAEQVFADEMKVNDQYMRSFIFVDSGWDADSVIAATWTTTPDDVAEGEEPRLDAVRVPMSIAERLLTLLDLGHITHLKEVFDEQQYADAYVDLHAGVERPDFSWPGRPSFELPESWPKSAPENDAGPAVFSLRHLTERDMRQLRKAIMTDDQAQESAQLQKVTIHNWPEDKDTPSRGDLWRIFHQLRPAISEDGSKAATFFVDNIVTLDDGGPQLIAVVIESRPQRVGSTSLLEIKPLSSADKMLPLLRMPDMNSKLETSEYANLLRLEKYHEPDAALDFGSTDNFACCPVFFLWPFTLDEERAIRTKISETSDILKGDETTEEYSYMGYVWPESDQSDHTVEELRDLFEVSNPASPFFRVSSHLRIASYPSHFVAVDRSIFSEESKVTLASTLDFGRFNGNELHSGDELGWQYGLTDAKEAHLHFINLDIANMGLVECVDDEDATELWLSDLKEYSEEYRRLKDDPDYDGEMPP